ncbi:MULTISPECIES: MerR family transcriptional regulator [Mesoflavibacter]|uniref:MerR family transcriptional regulator n=1 Tax=Mesoflavibacter TaxID=444051 RepID=UPI000D0E5EAA|nr:MULTISPECIES: MerR family transcriptional regulator [Mesoflavibacter]QIJ89818.1 Transcriptional regulator, MerR family [Mesoflavibacter sp. HG96]QIJ92546.1 Transcriptional regulator, MerR family [Mesoflavibacter sp. HG37]
MNSIKTKFSIKDLENLSGIKAHTIRIWEKRYNLFQPNRTDTNIRYYSLSSLQKILNISFLNNNGYKISKIAKLSETEIPNLVKEIAASKDQNNHSINLLKLAMINFDQGLFHKTYNKLIEEMSFREIFFDVFIPLLNHVGLLWQTDTITPTHEHFIVELIKKKILLHTEEVNKNFIPSLDETTYVIFLPENEMHELGIMYTNFELAKRGLHTIYLGQSVPIDSLVFLISKYNKISFVSSFTIQPEKENTLSYLDEFYDKLLKGTKNEFYVSGKLTEGLNSMPDKKIHLHQTTKSLIEHIK